MPGRCHFEVDRTLQLARERFDGKNGSKGMARKVVSRCQACARDDSAIKIRYDAAT